MRGKLMRATCPYCGRRLHYAKIPNRGPVMAHDYGDGEACRRRREEGRDLVSIKAVLALKKETRR